jgi:hypothetical protein
MKAVDRIVWYAENLTIDWKITLINNDIAIQTITINKNINTEVNKY